MCGALAAVVEHVKTRQYAGGDGGTRIDLSKVSEMCSGFDCLLATGARRMRKFRCLS